MDCYSHIIPINSFKCSRILRVLGRLFKTVVLENMGDVSAFDLSMTASYKILHKHLSANYLCALDIA